MSASSTQVVRVWMAVLRGAASRSTLAAVVASQVVASQVVASQVVASQVVASQAVASQAVASQVVASQAVASQAVASQAAMRSTLVRSMGAFPAMMQGQTSTAVWTLVGPPTLLSMPERIQTAEWMVGSTLAGRALGCSAMIGAAAMTMRARSASRR